MKELEEEAWEITSGELPKLIARSDVRVTRRLFPPFPSFYPLCSNRSESLL